MRNSPGSGSRDSGNISGEGNKRNRSLTDDGERDNSKEGGFSGSATPGSLVALSWNICGLGNPATVQRLREIHKRNAPDIYFLMETKNDLDMIKKTLHWLPLDNYHEVPPNSPGSGGLFLTWKNDIQLTVRASNKNFIDTLITEKCMTFQMTFVYGEPDHTKRLVVWNELSTLHPPTGKHWLLTGDFNEITDNSEKKGGAERAEGSFCAFRTFLSENELFDVKHYGNFLSWRGKRNQHLVQCRLDRSISNSEWMDMFPSCRSQYMRYEASDHRPLLNFLDTRRKKGKFRENSRKKIKELRTKLDEAMSNPVLDDDLIHRTNMSLLVVYKQEEEYWRQRSRQLWLTLGDANTRYFHATTKARKSKNRMTVIENEAAVPWFEEEQIAKAVCNYYEKLFASTQTEDLHILNEALHPCVTQQVNEGLIRDPTAEEIKEATFAINLDKAPGPDGFSASFFQANWEVVGPTVIKEVQHFFTTGALRPSQNITYVRLIPKIVGAKTVANYRPIALCNVFFKIISKLLTLRLKPVLQHIISENQSAFIPGRAIADNVLITHEVLQFLKTSQAQKRCTMAVKTDMSKAYDRLEWTFITRVLQRLGFHEKRINLIMQCVSTVSYSYLINDSAHGMVKPRRGIRQGDPLSPYLFILCSQVLSGLCQKAERDSTLQGIRVARGSPRVNHLLFADDTMFFCQTSPTSCAKLKSILGLYEQASGQQINVGKSSITFSTKAPPEIKRAVKEALGIEKEGGSGKYLGLPELFGRRKRDLFTTIVDRIRQQASNRSTRHLSKAGKLTMLKSVLTAIPTYTMSCFELPISLCKRIQSVLTRFWWNSSDGKRKMCWIAWDKLTKPKNRGGLGLRDIQLFNQTLLAKQAWRLLTNPNCLLARVLLGKCCHKKSFLEAQLPKVCSHGWRSTLHGRDLLKGNVGKAIRNGVKTKVWKESWISLDSNLRPFGPIPENALDLTVADLLTTDMKWNRKIIEELLPQVAKEIQMIQPGHAHAEDIFVWHPLQSETTTKAISLAREWNSAQHQTKLPNQTLPRERRAQTTNNEEGYMICKSDAAYEKKAKRARVAWIFSDTTGNCINQGTTTFNSISSPLIAEAIALRAGVLSAVDLEYPKLKAFSDNLTLIRAINNDMQVKEIFGIVKDIQQISSVFVEKSFSHVSRALNGEADRLAKFSLSNSFVSDPLVG
ncbi:uncharacterized protein LOC106453727 [Brassica napus]|uniref:uncharacterized protein LOC106453727 n=1 Tax=Brassica napus TaxID=3708 RepID=UPI002078FA07|nr:uncharacterized protein LOC106453727 [Brassica napus]